MAFKVPELGARLSSEVADARAVLDAGEAESASAAILQGAPAHGVQAHQELRPTPERDAGGSSVSRRFQALGALLIVLLLGAGTLVMLDRRHASYLTQYLAAAGHTQMLTQRIAAASQQAANGEAAAFDRLRAARDEFGASLALLTEGGERSGMRIPASDASLQPLLRELKDAWGNIEGKVALILKERDALLALQKRERTAETGAPGAAEPTAAKEPHPDARARQAARDISAQSEELLLAAMNLTSGYSNAGEAGSRTIVAAIVCGALALVCLLLMGKVILDEAERRAAESQRSAQRNERANQRTQAAILRLLDEMGNLAQGDLTVRASVSEEVTGAIADSVNYAVDELRRVVDDINRAAVEVASASSQAQAITGELLNAAQRQAQEIMETNTAVAAVAASIVQISARAAESALVADHSLAAANQGSGAVSRSIQGMDGIREQIQDTAKRIKRLGESSQEIGEIVDLISDITEQTNVLALNAAIQATSAGPAGRGFTMVAEEVQRLAERSAQATRQISAIVKTIQTDTQDATSAMERSTQGVVEQTGLADAAGQALGRIDKVSRKLATLIGAISAATHEQSESSDRIRSNMMDIQRITELTTEGTRKTADATERLARLALELKQSVAGFKLS